MSHISPLGVGFANSASQKPPKTDKESFLNARICTKSDNLSKLNGVVAAKTTDVNLQTHHPQSSKNLNNTKIDLLEDAKSEITEISKEVRSLACQIVHPQFEEQNSSSAQDLILEDSSDEAPSLTPLMNNVFEKAAKGKLQANATVDLSNVKKEDPKIVLKLTSSGELVESKNINESAVVIIGKQIIIREEAALQVMALLRKDSAKFGISNLSEYSINILDKSHWESFSGEMTKILTIQREAPQVGKEEAKEVRAQRSTVEARHLEPPKKSRQKEDKSALKKEVEAKLEEKAAIERKNTKDAEDKKLERGEAKKTAQVKNYEAKKSVEKEEIDKKRINDTGK